MIATSSVAAPVFDGQDSPTSSYPGAERHLLLVEQNEVVSRALKRLLSLLYDSVHVVSCARQATELLRQIHGTVDVLCGQRYDHNNADLDWVSAWRQQGSVGYVVLTASEPPAQPPAGVDTIFSKPLDPRALMRFLQTSVHHAA